jgi:adenosylcobinamide-GDP ribazoletransferase
LASLVLALRFLTIVPVPGREASGPGALGRAGWWFPVVGLALGAVLAGLDRALHWAFPPLLAALLVLTAWKVATGGIHLDGLADCLDGLGGRTPEHRLAIMRDPHVGAIGAVGLIFVVLLGLLALAEMPARLRTPVLLLAPVLGRVLPLLVMLLLRRARPGQGLAASFAAGLSRWAGPVHLAALLGLAGLVLGGWGACLIIAATLAAVAVVALLSLRLGGITGDVLGAAVELAELSVLLLAVPLPRLSAG